MKYLLIVLIATSLGGCAVSNEGAVDMRRTDQTQDADGLQTLNIKNQSLGNIQRFKKGDSLSLHLRSAYIKTFAEDLYFAPYIRQAFSRQWGEAKGEIAIVVNAFEELNGFELSAENQRDGRVVFYSGDVNEGQFLNFNNMPIYGPLTYQGAPFALRISIFELDVVSKQAKSMLKVVSDLGSQAYAPASPVLDVLNSIGSSFLSGDQTDTEFRYSMILDHEEGASELDHFLLETGNYVLVRSEDRSVPFDWTQVKLNENEGRLYKLDGTEYKDETYVVVEINKDVSNINVELAQNNFKTLMDTLAQQDAEKAQNIDAVQASFSKAIAQRKQNISFVEMKQLLAEINKRSANENADQREQLQSTLLNRRDIAEILTTIAGSVNDKGQVKALADEPALSKDQIDYLLEKLFKLSVSNPKKAFALLTPETIFALFEPDAPAPASFTKGIYTNVTSATVLDLFGNF